jgi:8-amino-7-oxononanoate synthase
MYENHTLSEFETQLAELDARQQRRTRRVVEAVDGPRLRVDGRELLAFCSNDYLGLSTHPSLITAAQRAAQQFGVGATASPLVCGHQSPHEALEQELAKFVGLPRALYFGSGYVANVGIVPALARRGDAVFCDALNHACLIDGTRLSGAERVIYPHNDVDTLARDLEKSTAARKIVVTDAVFSMDGDIAPLPRMLELCDRHDALLMIDDAHGFGVLGPQGRGTAAHFGLRSPRLVYMATLGKAAGVSGAFVAGDETVIEWLLQRARSYIFATATPAMVAEALRESLKRIEEDDGRRDQLSKLTRRLRQRCAGLPWRLADSSTAIQPMQIGANADAMNVMAALLERGLWVPAIRPPTVPEGTARLRITLTALHSEADIDRLTDALHDISGR